MIAAMVSTMRPFLYRAVSSIEVIQYGVAPCMNGPVSQILDFGDAFLYANRQSQRTETSAMSVTTSRKRARHIGVHAVRSDLRP